MEALNILFFWNVLPEDEIAWFGSAEKRFVVFAIKLNGLIR